MPVYVAEIERIKQRYQYSTVVIEDFHIPL